MAAIQENSGKQGKRKIHSTRVDLTPMVDLGFLLITFFIFTNTLSTATVMKIAMPKDSADSTKIAASGAISLIASSSEIIYVQGDNQNPLVKKYDWNDMDGLRRQLIEAKQRLVAANGDDSKLFVMIKPHDKSRFGQVIRLLDEMTICGIRRYCTAEFAAGDMAYVSTQSQ
ncbi:MAG TPA: biopolymer transporter ExbD [Phnomibacter sp.]|nr:biopolymer transporter ExbD [Phnomibacter sp.]